MLRSYVLFVILLVAVFSGAKCYRLSSDDYNGRYHLYDNYLNYNKERDSFQEDAGRLSVRSRKERQFESQLGDLPANGELFEQDIVMDERLRQHVLGVNKRTSLKYPDIKWPNGVLVYDIDKSFAPCARKLLEKAIKEYEKRTCITFKRRTDEKAYVLYTSEENVCSSNIGRTGLMQKIFIGHSCCVLGTVLHETMHALGFIHEHSRHDRDDYVNIMWDNIENKEKSNFNKYSLKDTTDNDVEYNLASVMHYRNDAFTRNGEDTLVVKGEADLEVGQRKKFSVGDVEGINRLYNCPKKPGAYDNLYATYSGKLAEKRKKDLERRKKEQEFLSFLKSRLGN